MSFSGKLYLMHDVHDTNKPARSKLKCKLMFSFRQHISEWTLASFVFTNGERMNALHMLFRVECVCVRI